MPQTETYTSEKNEMAEMISELRQLVDALGHLSHDAIVDDVVARLEASGAIQSPKVSAESSEDDLTDEDQGDISLYSFINEIADDEDEDEEFDIDKLMDQLDESSDDSHLEIQSGDVDETDDLSSFFDMLSEDETEDGEENEDLDSDAQSLMDYLQQLAKEEEAQSSIYPESDDGDETNKSEGEGTLDIMSFIEKAASELDNITVLQNMLDSGEVKRNISLNELVKLNKSRKN